MGQRSQTETRRVERLFDIFSTLIRDGVASRKRLIDMYVISTRTLLRDINDLSLQFGTRIEYDKESGCYFIPHDELEALRNNLAYRDDESVGEKIARYFLASLKDHFSLFTENNTVSFIFPEYHEYKNIISVETPPLSRISRNNNEAKKLLRMVEDLEEITFTYTKRSHEPPYQVNAIPYLMHFAGGRWYLVAEDVADSITKKYIVEKVSNLAYAKRMLIGANEVDEEIIEERERKRQAIHQDLKEKKSIFFTTDNPAKKVVIRFDAATAHYFLENDYGFKQECEPTTHKDGHIDVTFHFGSFEEVWYFLLPWLGHFTIISPDYCRFCFMERVTKALAILAETKAPPAS